MWKIILRCQDIAFIRFTCPSFLASLLFSDSSIFNWLEDIANRNQWRDYYMTNVEVHSTNQLNFFACAMWTNIGTTWI